MGNDFDQGGSKCRQSSTRQPKSLVEGDASGGTKPQAYLPYGSLAAAATNAQHASHAPCRETASRLRLASGPTTGCRPLFVFSPTSWNPRQQALTTNTCYFSHSPSQDPSRQRWWEPRFPNPAGPSHARRRRTVHRSSSARQSPFHRSLSTLQPYHLQC